MIGVAALVRGLTASGSPGRSGMLVLICLTSGCLGRDEPAADVGAAVPVISVDVNFPTADKPQSKLWYAEGRWWAWLPNAAGSSVWERTPQGWRREASLDAFLKNLSGRADVWSESGLVRAVLVASDRLSVATLTFDRQQGKYVPGGEPVVWNTSEPSATETATIARDQTGKWWVVYDEAGLIQARATAEDGHWSEPYTIAAGTRDDLCTIVALPESVGVFWSDSVADAYWFREHRNEAPPGEWEEIEEVDRGPGTADDHLNAAVDANGAVYVAARRRNARIGEPQLALYTRRDGGWSRKLFAERSVVAESGRPIVLLAGETNVRIFACYSSYLTLGENRRTSRIVGVEFPADRPAASQPFVLLEAREPLNNVTGCKQLLPVGVEWVVLASDGSGGIYEGRIPSSDRHP